MVPGLRVAFNAAFTQESYETFLKDLNSLHPGAIQFRIAETPVFIPKDFGDKIIEAGEAIIDVIVDPNFKKLTDRAIPKNDLFPMRMRTLILLHSILEYALIRRGNWSRN